MNKSLITKLGLLGLGLAGANLANLNAQTERYPKGHDHGAYFRVDESESNWNLEEKVFYGKRYFVQRVEETEENPLGLIFYDAHKVKVILDADTKKPIEIKSKEEIIFKREGNKLKLSQKGPYPLRAGGLCDSQVEKRGEDVNETGYIATDNTGDFIPDIRTVVMDKTEFYYPMVAVEKINEEGKTPFYLIIKDSTNLEVDYATKDISMLSSIFRGVSDTLKEERTIPIHPGQGSEVSTEEETSATSKRDSTQSKKQKETGARELYLIGGVNGGLDKHNKLNFLEGIVGLQFGHVAVVGNMGGVEDEQILNTQTDSSANGIYAVMKEANRNIAVRGLGFEVHPLIHSKVGFLVGAGANNYVYTKEEGMDIMKGKQLLKSNKSSKAISETLWKVYGGPEFNFKNSKLAIPVGYDSRQKFNAGVRYSIRLGRK